MLQLFVRLRSFSTANTAAAAMAGKVSCGFTQDFPALIKTTNTYNIALYNHLRVFNEKDQAMQAAFMELSTAKAEGKESSENSEKSQHEMDKMRKAMAKNS